MADGKDTDPLWMLLLLLSLPILFVWVVWSFYKPEILEALRWVRLVELAPFTLFSKQASACFSWLRQAQVGETIIPTTATYQAALACYGPDMLRSMPNADALHYYNLTSKSIAAISRFTGSYIRWIVLAVCAYFAYYALFKSPKNDFKTRHNLESLIRTQAKMWPVISPIVNFNPSKHSARSPGSTLPDKIPLFSEPLSPEEWLSYHRISITNNIPDREQVRGALLRQLGPRWQGFDGLPPYILALLAAFALKGVQKREESDELLGRLAMCWSKEKGFQPSGEVMAEVRKILKDPQIGGKAAAVAQKYAYRTTAVMGVLKWARYMGGVLASAHFLWMRGVDRELWYALNNLGRRSFHTEGAGAIAHYMAEEHAQKALPIPRLETAIVTINQYLAANQPKIPPREEPGKARA